MGFNVIYRSYVRITPAPTAVLIDAVRRYDGAAAPCRLGPPGVWMLDQDGHLRINTADIFEKMYIDRFMEIYKHLYAEVLSAHDGRVSGTVIGIDEHGNVSKLFVADCEITKEEISEADIAAALAGNAVDTKDAEDALVCAFVTNVPAAVSVEPGWNNRFSRNMLTLRNAANDELTGFLCMAPRDLGATLGIILYDRAVKNAAGDARNFVVVNFEMPDIERTLFARHRIATHRVGEPFSLL
jgi:hypothetical protein